MVCPACRYDSQQSCFRRCRCPCDGCAVGRVWHTPDRAELDTYESPETPYDDQGDMEEQAVDMDDEFEVHHERLQSQDNFTATRLVPPSPRYQALSCLGLPGGIGGLGA